MKKFILYFSILALCTTVFTSCEKEKYENRIIGAWIIKSMTVYETQNDGSVKESTSIFDDETLYFEFYDNGMYSMFGVPDGHWEILNGNKLYIEGRNFIYTILFLKSTEMELELVRDVNRRDVYYFVKKN